MKGFLLALLLSSFSTGLLAEPSSNGPGIYRHYFSAAFFAADSELFFNAGLRYDYFYEIKYRGIFDIGFGYGFNLSYIYHSLSRDRLNATFNENVVFNIGAGGLNLFSFLPITDTSRLLFFIGPNLDYLNKSVSLGEPEEENANNSNRVVAVSQDDLQLRFALATGAFFQADRFFLGGKLHLVFNTDSKIDYQLVGSSLIASHNTMAYAFALSFMAGVAF